MQLGTRFPQDLIGLGTKAVRDFVMGLEHMGYDYITVSDHVLMPATPQGGAGYSIDSAMREPIVLLAYMAGITTTLQLVTSIVIMPQRQTVLLAKQAAELDSLSGGRLRLGVGIGRIEMEYDALGKDFHNRGQRLEEQITLLRQLWSNRTVNFDGRWESVHDAGITPPPVQRPIPIWMGGGIGLNGIVDRALHRVARLAEGWCPLPAAQSDMDDARTRLERFLADEGKDPTKFPVEMRTRSRGSEEEWVDQFHMEKERGTSHFTVVPNLGRCDGAQPYLEFLGRFKVAVGK